MSISPLKCLNLVKVSKTLTISGECLSLKSYEKFCYILPLRETVDTFNTRLKHNLPDMTIIYHNVALFLETYMFANFSSSLFLESSSVVKFL